MNRLNYNNYETEIPYKSTDILINTHNKTFYILKRLFDIIFSILGIILLSPIVICCSILVKFDSKGPIIVKQSRIGRYGKSFYIYRFRTTNIRLAEEINISDGFPIYHIDNDPRITKIGKFMRKTSLNELPQLLNVLKGDMSIVGPRPGFPYDLQFDDTRQLVRLQVKPGITGLSQLECLSNYTQKDYILDLDCEYAKKPSILIDIKILLKTIILVFNRDMGY